MSLKEGKREGSDLSQFAFPQQEWPAVLFDSLQTAPFEESLGLRLGLISVRKNG
jgi:hypothetical protein